ncbi:MAG TPA: hypothetical protein VF788_02735 [Pseudonocardiaceae bacterium]
MRPNGLADAAFGVTPESFGAHSEPMGAMAQPVLSDLAETSICLP